ncbi:PAS domain S-box protein [Candidatus Bipolaricaulota bacterium]|nr:PAS domain S-box protein [Candidatus Bipolaricaulota bacterium]
MSLSCQGYQSLIENLPEALFLEDFEGNILEVNEEACRLLGYKKEELLDLGVEDLVPEGAPAFLPDQIDEATTSGKPLETTNIKKDGTEVPVELRGRILECEGQKKILVTVRDISERIVAGEKLEETKERYKRYFEELGDAIFIIGMGGEEYGKILNVNSTAIDQTGYSREELVGMNMIQDLSLGSPLELDLEDANKKLSQGETVSFTEKKERKDGSNYWTEVVVTPIEYEGREANLSINRDITDRKLAKEQLKQYKMAVEGSDDLIAACDKDYNYLFANPAYRNFYDVEEGEIRGYKVGDLIDDSAFRSKVKPRLDRCLQGERIEYEMERTHPIKETRQLRISYYPLKSEGEIHGIVATMRDITERKRTQQALNEERDKLRHLHDSVDKLQQQNDEKSILQTAVEVSESILDFELCAIDLIEGDYLVTKAISSGLSPDQTHRYEIGEGVGGMTVEQGETIWGNDLRDYPEAKPTNEDFRAFISVPVGKVGVLQVVSREVGRFNEEDVELAEILSNHLREEIMRVRLEKNLRQQAIHDPLTALYNRRYFNETLEEEVERCKRYERPVAFLMIDVNRFKEINDRYSHQTGDKVLQEVADLLDENVRGADTVVRYGGDEFLVMLPETNGEVFEIVDRLKAELAEWNERSSLIDFPLSLALGVSHWNPDQDRDVEDALKEADKKMYEDKDR